MYTYPSPTLPPNKPTPTLLVLRWPYIVPALQIAPTLRVRRNTCVPDCCAFSAGCAGSLAGSHLEALLMAVTAALLLACTARAPNEHSCTIDTLVIPPLIVLLPVTSRGRDLVVMRRLATCAGLFNGVKYATLRLSCVVGWWYYWLEGDSFEVLAMRVLAVRYWL